MDPGLALGEAAEKIGLVLAAGATATALVARGSRPRAIASAVAALLAAALLVGHIWDSDQFRSISGDATRFVLLLAVSIAVIVALAALFLRHPAMFPLLVAATIPFRVPIDAGGSTANLLVPLYAVIAAAVAAALWRVRSQSAAVGTEEQKQGREQEGAASAAAGPVRVLCAAIATFLTLYAIQSLYSRDFETALEQMVFFYVPFALMFRSMLEVRWTPALLVSCGAVLLALALVFSVIGFWEYDRRELLWNPKVISANEFESYFRVNSVFWDPNVYGRFLAIVMIVVAACVVWSGRTRVALAGAAVLAVLWGGLVLTFSQSSFVALLSGLTVLAALRWNARRALVTAAVGGALLALVALAFQDTLRVELGSSSGLNRATSGRADLIEGGVDLFGDRPLWGYGSGSFARAYRQERLGNQQQAVSASHTLPLTVAAEQGILGLAAYAALLAACFWVLLGSRPVSGRAPPLDGRPAGSPVVTPAVAPFAVARAALAAAFVALVVHTMMYAAFLEDPFTWVVLAVGAAIAPEAARAAFVRSPSSGIARPAAAPV